MLMDVDNGDGLKHSQWFNRSTGVHGKHYGGKYVLDMMRWTATPSFVELANLRATHQKDVYEFGVYTGGSMLDIAQQSQRVRYALGL